MRNVFLLGLYLLVIATPAMAKDVFSPINIDDSSFKKTDGSSNKIELQGDTVSYSATDNKATAIGNVVVTSSAATMYADKIEMDRTNNQASAEGHVYIDTPQAKIDASKAQFDFNQGTGSFQDARIANDPYYIGGKEVDKLSDSYYQMINGYMTTCDHDHPHFRLQPRRMDYYQNDKAIARGIKFYVGNVPVMYLPKYTYDLKDKPWITFIPGKSKDFGVFLLTTIRLKINSNAKLIVHVDYRERKGIAEGFDYKYSTARTGSGILKTYYINEYTYPKKHPWMKVEGQKRTTHERYKVEWRHRWNPDAQTDIITQYFRMRDPDFLKDYFERQYRQDPNTNTYFLLTRTMPKGTLSFNIDASRVNRYSRSVERLPEVRYSLSNQELGDSGFYIKSQNTFSNLVKKEQHPEHHRKTIRMDTDNELSYPYKIAFVETRPFVGGQNTYYSSTANLSQRSVMRNIFRFGSDVSTKFYRVWNYKGDKFGIKIDRLRHVIAPSFKYIYQHRPTIPSANLNQFDGIDSAVQLHAFRLGLENKLQTKRKGRTVDFVRFLLSSDFLLKEDQTGRPGLTPIKGDIEFKPTDWLSLNTDATYDHKHDYFSDFNFEAVITNGDKWSLALGRRYARNVDDQYTAELNYRLNPKWKVKIYDRYEVRTGTIKEENYVLTRDLHEWEMDFDYHQLRGGGSEIMLIFRLKAFPDMDLNLLSTSYHQRKAGSQQ